jgi:hypothetical protein
MLSPDNYTQGGSQGYNRYTYAMNNPLKYTDPSGQILAPVLYGGAALLGGAQNLYSNWGKVKGNWKIGLAYFVSGAVGGMVSVTNRVGGGALTAYANLGIDIVTGNVPGPNASLWETAKYVGGLGLDGLGAASAPDIVRLGGRALAALGGEWIQTASWFGKASATTIASDVFHVAAEGGPVITATLKGVGERAASGIGATLGKNFANHGADFIDDGARMVEQSFMQNPSNVIPSNLIIPYNTIPEGKLANHIFSGELGKLLDTPGSRQLLTDLTNDTGNLLGRSKYGVDWYARILPDNTQLYGYTQNGIVKGAGINQIIRDIFKIKGLQ